MLSTNKIFKFFSKILKEKLQRVFTIGKKCSTISAASSGKCGTNVTWTLDDNGTLIISGAGAMYYYSSDDAPWYSYRNNIKTVIIQDGVTSIVDEAFPWCSSLTSITIPDSVTIIGDYAFEDCTSLESIIIPDSVTSIGDYAFDRCSSLISVTIPDSVTSIGDYAFGYYYDYDNWEYVKVENFTITGVKGSAAEVYATENGFTFIALDVTKLPENNFYMDEETSTMPNIVENTKVSGIISTLGEYGITATVTDKNGNAVADIKVVGTGAVVKISDGKEFTVIVNGDVDGNGMITATDYLHIKNSLTGRTNLSGCYKTAADTDGNEIISSTDYLIVKAYLVGKSELYK